MGVNELEKSSDVPRDSSSGHEGYVTDGARPSLMTRMGLTADSFKKRTLDDETTQLNRDMKSRHLQMIAIGGSIGAGFFVGSGSALTTGGPATLLIDFAIMGIMIFNVVYALGELAIMYPVSGGFYTYSTRFIDPSWGFAMGWNYVFQWVIVIPLELTVASFTCQYWNKDVNIAIYITVFWIVLILISIFGVLGYAEEEFWASALKLITVIIFLIVGLVLVCGGGPKGGKFDHFWGTTFYQDPGAFQNGFKGFCGVFVTAAFAFSGTELVGLAAAESKNPARSLPGAVKQVFWRITLFYILGLLFVGLLVSSKDDRLLNPGNPYANGTSPFVLAVKDAGLVGLDSFINFVILVSVISISLSGVYGGSRTLVALAEQGYAPKFFKTVDRAGRPTWATIFVLAFGPLAYVQLASSGGVVFDWLLALSGLAALFTWGSILLSHIRFRKAWAYHGHSVDEIPFRAPFGVWGSWFSLFIIFIVLLAQFYTALNLESPEPAARVESFFKAYLTVPIVIAFWIGGFFWKRSGWLRTSQMDVQSGRRDVDIAEIEKYRAKQARMSKAQKFFSYFF